MKIIDHKTYLRLYDKIEDYIQDHLDYSKDNGRLRRSFIDTIKGLLGEVPFNLKGALTRHILLEPEYNRAINLIISWKYSRGEDTKIEFKQGIYASIEKDSRLDSVIKILKKNWSFEKY